MPSERPPIGSIRPQPLGFPACADCTHRDVGPTSVCVACAHRTIEEVGTSVCLICTQKLAAGESCRNSLCGSPARRISRIHAISYLSGDLRRTILRYKYDQRFGWAYIFGRLVLGFLDSHAMEGQFDLIVANPTWPVDDRLERHTERVLEAASTEDVLDRYPFDTARPAAIVVTGEKPRSAGQSLAAKQEVAEALRSLLLIPDETRTAARRILVYDDVCTTGSQLNAIAACLLDDGDAADVTGLVLARKSWG